MKNTIYSALSLVLLMLVVPGCAEWFKKTEAPAAAAQAVAEPKFRLIDLNTEEVYKDAHIPGAMHVDLARIEEIAAGWNKETPIISYCSDYTCTASHSAAKKLKELGFKDVAVYAGGMNEWHHLGKENKAQYPLEGEAKLDYLQKVVEKTTPAEGEHVVSAEDLSKRLEEAKK
jgi:rhodanese-related sulfurtransferase